MPQIIVTADRGAAFGDGAVTLRERVTVADFESDHFGRQLVERLGWAVGDADAVERVDEPTEPTYDTRESGDREPAEPRDCEPAEPGDHERAEPADREPARPTYDSAQRADRVSVPLPA